MAQKIQSQECRIREITDSMKCSNVRIIAIPKGLEKQKGLEEIFEQIVAEDFPNLAEETSIRVQEAERTPPKVNEIRPTPLSHHSAIHKSWIQGYSLESGQGEENPSVQREKYQNYVRPVYRDLAGQEGLARHFQSSI